jgi:hypothetical protein
MAIVFPLIVVNLSGSPINFKQHPRKPLEYHTSIIGMIATSPKLLRIKRENLEMKSGFRRNDAL